MTIGAALLYFVLGHSASGQTLDCSNPMTQVEMTGCAAQDFEASDAALNAAYRAAIAMVRRWDSGQPGLDPSNEAMLRDAQRAWIPYRDQACAAESTIARGGTMQNQLFYLCLDRLTEQRTNDLLFFTEFK